MPHPIPPRPRAHGFTLVEILIAMAVLVIGFTSIAAILLSGGVSVKRGQEEVEGHIGAVNAVELLKGQGLVRCDMEFPWSHTDTPRSLLQEALSIGIASGASTVADPATPGGTGGMGGIVDDEICGMMAYNHGATNPNVPAAFLRYLPWGGADWRSMFNISNNGVNFPSNSDSVCGGGSPTWLADGADMTDFTRGRIRGLHHRCRNSVNKFRGDFAYPLFVSDPERRGIHVSLALGDAAYNAVSSNFVVVAMAGRKREGDTWPEMTAGISTPWARCANMWDRKMIATGVNDATTCAGLYDGAGSGFPTTFYWYGSRNQSFSAAPATRPGAYSLPATMYDQANDEICIAYPDGANFPRSSYTAGNATAVSWADPSRRIGIGDTIVSRDTGDVFHVQAVRDHPRADRVGGNAMIQILTVYPPLKSTKWRPCTVDPWSTGYYITGILFMPRCNTGGASPLVGVEVLNANQAMRFDRFN